MQIFKFKFSPFQKQGGKQAGKTEIYTQLNQQEINIELNKEDNGKIAFLDNDDDQNKILFGIIIIYNIVNKKSIQTMQKLVQEIRNKNENYMIALVGTHRDEISEETHRQITYSQQSDIAKSVNGFWAEVGLNDKFNYNTLKLQIQAKCKSFFKQFKQSSQYKNIQQVSENNIVQNQLSIILTEAEINQQKEQQKEQQIKEEYSTQESQQQSEIQEINALKSIKIDNIQPKIQMVSEETQYTPKENTKNIDQNFDIYDPKLSLVNSNQDSQEKQQNQNDIKTNETTLTKDQLDEQQEEQFRQINLKQLQDQMKLKIAKESLNKEYKPRASRLGVHYLNKEFAPAIQRTHEPIVKDEELMKRIENYKLMSSRKFLQQQRQQEEELKATVQKIVIQDDKIQEFQNQQQKQDHNQNEIQKLKQTYDAKITIEYNNNQYDLLIKRTDDPIQRAKSFCNSMGIPEDKINKIAVLISQQIQNVIRQEQQQELTQQDLIEDHQQKIDAIFQITVGNKQYDLGYISGQKADILTRQLCQTYNLNYEQNKHNIIQQIQEMIKLYNQKD